MKNLPESNAWFALLGDRIPATLPTRPAATCPVCGEPFDLARPWQKFCSKKCQQLWHYRIKQDRLRQLEHDKEELIREIARLRSREENC